MKPRLGGQPGHQQHLRQSLPEDRVNETLDYQINSAEIQRLGPTATGGLSQPSISRCRIRRSRSTVNARTEDLVQCWLGYPAKLRKSLAVTFAPPRFSSHLELLPKTMRFDSSRADANHRVGSFCSKYPAALDLTFPSGARRRVWQNGLVGTLGLRSMALLMLLMNWGIFGWVQQTEADDATKSPPSHKDAAAESFIISDSVAAFLQQHCLDCHSEHDPEAGLDLSALSSDLHDASTFAQWRSVFRRVEHGEMPPESASQPEPDEVVSFLQDLKEPLLQADQHDITNNGRVRSRRLTRTEYEHSVHDLLGIDMPLQNLLPEDAASFGFQTVAKSQQLSHHLLAVYLDVADLALQNAFDRAFNGDAHFQEFYSPDELARQTRGNYRGPDLKDGKSISWPITLQFFGRMYPTRVPEDGWYRIRLRDVHAVNPNENGSVWGTLRSGWCEANAPIMYMIGLVEATEEPRDMVYEAWIRRQHCLELKPNDATLDRPPTGAKGGNVSFAGRDLAADGFSGIAHHGIDVERIYPNADLDTLRKNLFGTVNLQEVRAGSEQAILSKLVTRFARRAFRRPVTQTMLKPYIAIGQQVLDDGDSLKEAARASYRAVLCSPRFLTLVETPGPLDDYAIASRLSYALWTSPPDSALLALARDGKLHEPDILAGQIQRMLLDVKAERFVNSFTDQWLTLNQIDFTTPEPKLYRTFDPSLQESMLQETRSFVTELIRGDQSVRSLIDSDFAFINERLSRHYDLPAKKIDLVAGSGVQKVSLQKTDAIRGGLLTQAAILKVTADGTHTSPIVRGVFINERILGEHIPPPPPGVPAIEPDIRGATSIRDQLDKHRSDESCASCHRVIDPPGFALENFDPIGSWRKNYGVRGSGVPIDASGATPQGESFRDISQWKKIYSQRTEQLAATFVKHFLTYATGAPPRFADEEVIEAIVASTAESGYTVRSLIHASLQSPTFLIK